MPLSPTRISSHRACEGHNPGFGHCSDCPRPETAGCEQVYETAPLQHDPIIYYYPTRTLQGQCWESFVQMTAVRANRPCPCGEWKSEGVVMRYETVVDLLQATNILLDRR